MSRIPTNDAPHDARLGDNFWPWACWVTLAAAGIVMACVVLLAPSIGMRAATIVGATLLLACGVLEMVSLYGWLATRSREGALNILTLGILGLVSLSLLSCALLHARETSRRLKKMDNLRSFQIERLIDNQLNPLRNRRPMYRPPEASPVALPPAVDSVPPTDAAPPAPATDNNLAP